MHRDDEQAARTPAAKTTRRAVLAGALASAGYASLSSAAPPPAASRSSASWRHPALTSLLQRNQELRPEYGGGFSNHVSMGLYALSALGGSGEQLGRFAEAHWAALEPLPKDPGPTVTAGNWSQWLGRSEALNGFRALFAAAIRRQGREATLLEYLPGLLPGIGAGAFHPLIRTAYGLRFSDDQELADGLSYWATAFLPLGALGPAGSERDPRALLQKIHERRSLAGRELARGIIMARMRVASELPDFAPAVAALRPSDTTLPDLAAAVLRLYLQSGDFTALHAVTGTHAYRVLSRYVKPSTHGVRYFWQALAAAYVSVGAPRLVEPEPATAPSWTPTIERALASLDAHDLKLVDVAREEEAFYRSPLYRRAAARRMRLV